MRSFLLVALAVVATASTAGAKPHQPRVEPGAQMSVPRAVHTATRLRDGTVLVVGGCTRAGCALGGSDGRVAEIYRPRERRFVRVGRLREWRDDHSAALLEDGRILIAGGWGAAGVLATTELYGPRPRTFAPGSTMASPRAGATATVLRDGRVLLAGGFTDNRPTTAHAEVFLPRQNVMRPVPPMTAARGGHAAVRLRDGRVLLAGGLSQGRVVRHSEIFNPRTNSFHRAASMRAPRYKAAAALLRDGRALIIGGAADIDGRTLYRTTELYDPRRGVFTPGPRMRFARYKLIGSVVTFANGDLLVAGGAEAAELYDARSGRFRIVPGHLDSPRLFSTATRIGRRAAVLVGGYDPRITPTRQSWLYR